MGFHKISIVFDLRLSSVPLILYLTILCHNSIVRQSELHCYIEINYQFTLIVFTQVNSRPTMVLQPCVLLFNGSEPMGILQPSILIPFIDD